VGGNAQTKAMKKVAGSLRLNLAQYRELAAFTQFGSDLDQATLRQLTRGERMVELLKQVQYKPVPVEVQVVQIFAGNLGIYDKLPAAQVEACADALVEYLREHYAESLHELAATGKLDSVEEKLKAAILEFSGKYTPAAG
jgi:F-type H+/Na+-transporting ATPase subunit alpha